MSLEKCTWKATLKPGKKAEYIRRHDEIWPEMTEVLTRAGIRNYTIWCCGDELFGYYECEKGATYAAKVQAESPVVDRWNEFMRDVMGCQQRYSGTGSARFTADLRRVRHRSGCVRGDPAECAAAEG